MSGPREVVARPTCATCDKPVESFTEEHLTGTLTGRVAFVARCHGETERVVVWRQQTKGLNFGHAFLPPNRLRAPAPRALLR